jgi:dTDP-4-amino-4,6-dideoxygalactose transaminase
MTDIAATLDITQPEKLTSYRDKLHNFLKEKGISTDVHYYPDHLYRIYIKYYRKLSVTENIGKNYLPHLFILLCLQKKSIL